MQIQSKIERAFWIRTLLSIIPDALIGVVISYATDSNLIVAVIATVIGLQILGLVLLAKNILWNWIVFRLSGERETLRNDAFEFLRKNKFPEPNEYLHDPDTYFQAVMDNARFPCDQRIKAAIELATSQCMAKFQGKIRIAMAWENAIERYKQTFPPRVYQED
jgi:hypothetical protein